MHLTCRCDEKYQQWNTLHNEFKEAVAKIMLVCPGHGDPSLTHRKGGRQEVNEATCEVSKTVTTHFVLNSKSVYRLLFYKPTTAKIRPLHRTGAIGNG